MAGNNLTSRATISSSRKTLFHRTGYSIIFSKTTGLRYIAELLGTVITTSLNILFSTVFG
jgi:hypothetical protein